MQTLLSRFCHEFVGTIRPLLKPLAQAAEAVAAANGDGPRQTYDQLLDLRHQVGLLTDKVAEQQAYVLIFGPLKSGKSTLMNAISASYVSEVTSLPAYPCMVYVAHSKERQLTATKYDGAVQTFGDLEELQKYLDVAHTDLARRVRASEDAGATFDPIDNYRDAVRRIDVRLPIDVLAPSRAVLVDTPGLYTRMKFGYDRMTRDFQNAAACAVFVVRSDNLFLDQVFAEFTKLLALFSRIFLVVNVDSNKQDVGPDGELVPSLEQADPARIIAAFENLTMSAPLKKAAEDGRLRIYPVDLLKAAQQRLSKTPPAAEKTQFDRFFADLTEYLNSTDYLVAFLGDSLRRATSLVGEVSHVCQSPEIKSLQLTLETLGEERGTTEAKITATRRLAASDWSKGLDWLRQDTRRVLHELASDIEDKTSRELSAQVDRWFTTNQSLGDLVQRSLQPILASYQAHITTALRKELSERLVGGHAGLRVSREVAELLKQVSVDLGAVGRAAHEQLVEEPLTTAPPKPFSAEHIGVRKTVWDWVLFRSQAAVRRRLFGADDRQPLARETKSQRLGEGARAELTRRLAAFKSTFFQTTREQAHERYLGRYTSLVQDGLRELLQSTRARFGKQLERLETECTRLRKLLAPFGELRKTAETAGKSVKSLSDHYGQMDLFMLTKPVEPEYTLPAAVPAKGTPASTTKKNGGPAKTTSGSVTPKTPASAAPVTKPAPAGKPATKAATQPRIEPDTETTDPVSSKEPRIPPSSETPPERS